MYSIYLDLVWIKSQKSVEKLPKFPQQDLTYSPRNSGSNTAQYLNVSQRMQVGHYLYYHSDCLYPTAWIAVTDSLPEREFVHGQPNLLPINLARL